MWLRPELDFNRDYTSKLIFAKFYTGTGYQWDSLKFYSGTSYQRASSKFYSETGVCAEPHVRFEESWELHSQCFIRSGVAFAHAYCRTMKSQVNSAIGEQAPHSRWPWLFALLVTSTNISFRVLQSGTRRTPWTYMAQFHNNGTKME